MLLKIDFRQITMARRTRCLVYVSWLYNEISIPIHATNHRASRADAARAAKVIAAQLGGQLAGRRSCASPSHSTNRARAIRHPVQSLLLILVSDPVRHLPTDPYQNLGLDLPGSPYRPTSDLNQISPPIDPRATTTDRRRLKPNCTYLFTRRSTS